MEMHQMDQREDARLHGEQDSKRLQGSMVIITNGIMGW